VAIDVSRLGETDIAVDLALTCPPKTGPQIMRVLDGNRSQGGQHAWQPVYAGADLLAC
jgi:hypothetical protein